MTAYQCPKCELRFLLHTVLDDHVRNDHPSFHHEYPVRGVHHVYEDEIAPEPAPARQQSAEAPQ